MKKAAYISSSGEISPVYGGGRYEKLGELFDLFPENLTAEMIDERHEELGEIQYLFSTWGMPRLTSDQVARLPALEAVFYGAGTVQSFAVPFLEAGVKVVSAWAANAIPVAEYTVAQILLANKGFFTATRCMKTLEDRKKFSPAIFPGNFETSISLLGAGMIGRAVIERLKPYCLDILVFDPFLSDSDAEALGVEKVELEEAFERGLVVSNHLANLPETKAMLKGPHFASMPPYATFINTGRGATLDEDAMIEALQARADLTAVLDVTFPEPPAAESALYTLDNVVMTPHIAGSTGQEIWRMADFMIDEAVALSEGRALKYEVSMEMLKTMA
jgi:phosphoglycerate dehydrogenase-like enzyme